MATQEKLQKSLEVLRVLCNSNQTQDVSKKKEKIHHIHVVTEAICNPTIKVASNFHAYLSGTVEILIRLCDDQDTDVRMITEESLNRIIKASMNDCIGKIQIELHKEIKRNGAAKSVRAALWRFAQLAHLIRPIKGRAYVDYLFPSLRKMTERHEEQVHETLASSLEKIMKHLGWFSSDNEIKLLLRAFLNNVSHQSAIIRRSSVSCLLHICLNSRKPSLFVSYCLNNLLDVLLPLNESTNNTTIIGVLNGIKALLPNVNVKSTFEQYNCGLQTDVTLEKFLQIYELCLTYIQNKDHNIINAALETLNILLLNGSDEMKKFLMCKDGLGKSRIHGQSILTKTRSPSQLSVATNLTTTDENLGESELTETLNSDIQKWIDQSQLSVMNVGYSRAKDLPEKTQSLDSIQGVISDDSDDFSKLSENYSPLIKNQAVSETLTISENSSEKSSCVEEKDSDVVVVDIGDIFDQAESLMYCARLIAKNFLLNGNCGGLIADKVARVSVKSLALNCLATLVTLQPKILQNFLGNQEMSDVFLFAKHSDPQLRGIVRLLICNFVHTVLIDNNGDYIVKSKVFDLDNLVDILVEGLTDESSNCSKQTINSLNTVLTSILESNNSKNAIPILDILPSLSKNPYWLVKVALCELVSKLPYATIYHILGDNSFQNKVLHNILLEMLYDNDQRVRHSAANSISQIIPNLYSDQFHSNESVITTKAINFKGKLLNNLFEPTKDLNLNRTHFIENMPFPYNKILQKPQDTIEFILSKLLNKLYKTILTSTSKHYVLGCLETLMLLSRNYPPTIYIKSWTVSQDSSPDILGLCVSLLTNSIIVYDVTCHDHLLELTSNVFAGQSVNVIRPIPNEENSQLWSMFETNSYLELCENYFGHIVKLLNIFHHILNDLAPTNAQSKEKRMLSAVKEEKLEKSPKFCTLACFAHLPYYMKIYEVLRSSYSNFKVSFDSNTCDRFLDILKNVLKSLSVLMEIGGLTEIERLAEDILLYLKSTFALDPTSTVECVQQMLKCMFSINLTANIGGILDPKRKEDEDSDEEEGSGFYYHVAQKPYSEISKCINSLNTINRIECDGDSTLMGYLHRKDIKLSTTLSRTSDKILGNYIRIFEPMVIKSLKQYTITSDVKLQSQVLQLLSQLVVQLKVNYCLLDSDQVFIGFVFKQFDYIEEGQIPFPEELIPRIFQFLVQLSYRKQHSKSIIGIPKILQLCDGLLASGQSPLTHCIPALHPIVEDIFLVRNKSNTIDMKELETTREVVLSILLKLAEHHEVIELLVLILEDSKYCLDDPEKWLRWSQLILNAFVPMLKQNKIRLDDEKAFSAMRRFVFALNPNALKPLDQFIVMLFQDPPTIDSEDKDIGRWICRTVILFLILSPIKEDILIAKIGQLTGNFSPSSIFENVVTTADPLNVTNSANAFQGLSSEQIFIKLIFRLIDVTSQRCGSIVKHKTNDFTVQQFSIFLMHCLHMFQSGSHCKIANVAIEELNKEDKLEKINQTFKNLANFHPILSFQWCYLLTLLNYKNLQFWSDVLNNLTQSLNMEIMKTGALIVFCDYLIENVQDINLLSWILTTNIHLIVKLYQENPVTEFIYSLHRNDTTSGLLISAIRKSCTDTKDAIFVKSLVECIKNGHSSQCGPVLHFLLTKLIGCEEVAISRNVAYVASRKIDFLLTLRAEEVHNQLSKEELLEVVEALSAQNLTKKHETLTSILNKLLTKFYDLPPIELDQWRIVDPQTVKSLKIDKTWYISQIKGRFHDNKLGRETAQLLKHLEYTEILSFLNSPNFNKICIKDCIAVALLEKNNHVILKASADCIFQNIANVCGRVPKPHQVFSPEGRALTPSEKQYAQDITELFEDNEWINLIPPLTSYIKSLPLLETPLIPENSLEDTVKFGVLALESINFLISRNKISLIDSVLKCAKEIFKENHLCSILALDSHNSWLCSAINSLYKIVDFLLLNEDPLPSIPKYGLKKTLENIETSSAGHACHQLYILVSWMEKNKKNRLNIPIFLLSNIKDVIISLSRMPLVNSYILIPIKVWKTGWNPEMSGFFHTNVPPLPIDLLQEGEILEEYIYRITQLGWTTRQQFEETWMCLLSVLCNPIRNVEEEELNDIIHGTSLAIKAITYLLLKTLYLPIPGNILESKLISVSRNAVIKEDDVSVQKLKIIHNNMQQKYHDLNLKNNGLEMTNVFEAQNFEKLNSRYRFGQLSIRYFLIATNIIEECDENDPAATIFKNRSKILEDHGLDLNSCLQFLLDYYTQIITDVTSHVRVIYEAVKSTVIISDLFTEKSQFQWMLDTFLELSKTHMIEDDLVHQYLIIGICKASSILIPDLEVFENVKKLLQNLKSPFIPLRNACLYGILYILEGCKINNISIGGISEEMQLILPSVVEYLQLNLNSKNNVLRNSLDHTMLIWSIAFYLIENVDESHMELNFVTNTLKKAFVVLQDKELTVMHKSIIKGLERLIIVNKSVMEKIGKSILKLALEKMKHDNPSVALLGTQLLITYMYMDCSEHLKTDNSQTSPDQLVLTIEKISAMFKRIKKGYEFEVEILTSVLPKILDDFFTPSDVLTKVISEFLSPQQPHPKLLSRVVFEVFGSAIRQNQLSLLQDWVVFSLSNFTTSCSVGLAIWCLTCFFISASTNEHLRSVFPYVQTRVGRLEYEDKKMLCIAGSNFFNNLTNEKQKQTFIENFTKVKDTPNMPYNDLLNSL